jgi:hypothetical protein
VYLLAQPLAKPKNCSPSCPSFKCGKNAAWFRRDGVWCKESEEYCNVAKCNYPICFKRRLLPEGICGETVKRKTVEREPEDFFQEDPKPKNVVLKGKALRKLGDEDEYY